MPDSGWKGLSEVIRDNLTEEALLNRPPKLKTGFDTLDPDNDSNNIIRQAPSDSRRVLRIRRDWPDVCQKDCGFHGMQVQDRAADVHRSREVRQVLR